MTKLAFNLPVILVLAVVPSPGSAQNSALTNPLVDQSGCVDFSGEYMGCLTLGPALEEQQIARRSHITEPKATIDPRRAAPKMESQASPSSTQGPPPGSSAASQINFEPDDTIDVLTASGHLGAP